MDNQIDWDKKYQEDLERAQALSLESLALEQFRQSKLLQERSNCSKISKNASVNRASSMSETDDHQHSKSRPRPGVSLLSQKNALLAPPPSSQRKNSITSDNEMPDLISFSSSPSEITNVLDFCHLQQSTKNDSNCANLTQTCPSVINSQVTDFTSTTPFYPFPSDTFSLYKSYQKSLSDISGSFTPFMSLVGQSKSQGQIFNMTAQRNDEGANKLSSLSGVQSANFPDVPQLQQKRLSTPNPGTPCGITFKHPSSSFQARNNVNAPGEISLNPPLLPPKNQHRVPPQITLPSSLSTTVKAQRRQKLENLIDLAAMNLDNNSVRVSILQEFDPILCSNDNFSTSRTISPECTDDSASACDSVYDEYDPYDFIYTGSGNHSLSDSTYATIINKVESYSSKEKSGYIHKANADKNRMITFVEVTTSLLENITQVEPKSNKTDSELLAFFDMVQNVRNKYRHNDPDTNMGFVVSPMVNYQYREETSIKLCVYPDFEGADFDKPFIFTCDGKQ